VKKRGRPYGGGAKEAQSAQAAAPAASSSRASAPEPKQQKTKGSASSSSQSGAEDMAQASTDSDAKSPKGDKVEKRGRPKGSPNKQKRPRPDEEQHSSHGEVKKAKVNQEAGMTDQESPYVMLPAHLQKLKPPASAAPSKKKQEAMEDLALGHIEETAGHAMRNRAAFKVKRSESPWVDELELRKQKQQQANEAVEAYVKEVKEFVRLDQEMARGDAVYQRGGSRSTVVDLEEDAPVEGANSSSSSSSTPPPSFAGSRPKTAAERKEAAALNRTIDKLGKLLEEQDIRKAEKAAKRDAETKKVRQPRNPQGNFTAGEWVSLHGLNDSVHLNDKVGSLVAFVPATGRWQVSVEGVHDMYCNLRAANMKTITEEEARKRMQPEEVLDIW